MMTAQSSRCPSKPMLTRPQRTHHSAAVLPLRQGLRRIVIGSETVPQRRDSNEDHPADHETRSVPPHVIVTTGSTAAVVVVIARAPAVPMSVGIRRMRPVDPTVIDPARTARTVAGMTGRIEAVEIIGNVPVTADTLMHTRTVIGIDGIAMIANDGDDVSGRAECAGIGVYERRN